MKKYVITKTFTSTKNVTLSCLYHKQIFQKLIHYEIWHHDNKSCLSQLYAFEWIQDKKDDAYEKDELYYKVDNRCDAWWYLLYATLYKKNNVNLCLLMAAFHNWRPAYPGIWDTLTVQC